MYLYLYLHLYTGYYLPWVPEVFLACGGNFRCWPKAGAKSGLTETGNRARKVSGTQGSYYSVKEHLFVCSSFSVSIIACVADGFLFVVRKVRDWAARKQNRGQKRKWWGRGWGENLLPSPPSPLSSLGLLTYSEGHCPSSYPRLP